jgi:hypothetical protein
VRGRVVGHRIVCVGHRFRVGGGIGVIVGIVW